MTEEQVRERIKQIRLASRSMSSVGMQLEMMALMCEVFAAQKIAPDQYIIDIVDFHRKFGLEYVGPPRALVPDMSEFRIKFLQEELDEYKQAVKDCDLEKQCDSLIDLVYVALGTAHLQGFPFQAGWQRVQDANMAKVRGTKRTSPRGSTYDVVKPRGWIPPSLTDLVTPPIE